MSLTPSLSHRAAPPGRCAVCTPEPPAPKLRSSWRVRRGACAERKWESEEDESRLGGDGAARQHGKYQGPLAMGCPFIQ